MALRSLILYLFCCKEVKAIINNNTFVKIIFFFELIQLLFKLLFNKTILCYLYECRIYDHVYYF